MVHPLVRLLATRPQLLADHAEAYAELAAAELGAWSGACKSQLVLGLLGLAGLVVAAVLAGVAVMLWAVTPPTQLQAPWALVAAPLLPLLLALAGLAAVSRRRAGAGFETLRRQLDNDRTLLREALAR